MVREALAIGGWPAIIAASDSVAGDAATPVYFATKVSHSYLFPKLAAVVHHAGAGTTQRTTLAGVPSVTIPVLGDQPYWARRLVALGLSPSPVPYAKLSPHRLADAIKQATTNPRYAERARQVSARMSEESGPAVAAERIIQLL